MIPPPFSWPPQPRSPSPITKVILVHGSASVKLIPVEHLSSELTRGVTNGTVGNTLKYASVLIINIHFVLIILPGIFFLILKFSLPHRYIQISFIVTTNWEQGASVLFFTGKVLFLNCVEILSQFISFENFTENVWSSSRRKMRLELTESSVGSVGRYWDEKQRRCSDSFFEELLEFWIGQHSLDALVGWLVSFGNQLKASLIFVS